MMRLTMVKVAGAAMLVVCLLMAGPSAWAGDSMRQGKKDYQAMDFEDARETFTAHAEKGDAEAQYYLGLMSWYGFGCEQDHELARKRLVQASDQDFKPAKWGLAMFQQYGLDIDLSPEEALVESNRLMEECGVSADTRGTVRNEHANRFVGDSMVLIQAMADEMNQGNRYLSSDREKGIEHLHKAEEYLVVAQQSGPMFSQPSQFILFNLHAIYRKHGIEPSHPELYERTQRQMKTGGVRAEEQRQQLTDKLKEKYGAQ